MADRRRIALLAVALVAVALVVTGSLVAVHILTHTTTTRNYQHERLVWTQRFSSSGGFSYVTGVAFTPDGNTLAVAGSTDAAGDTGVTLWDVRTHRRIASLVCGDYTGQLKTIAISPDGRFLAGSGPCGSEEWAIRVWDLASHRLVATMPGDSAITSIAFRGDGQLLAGGGYQLTGSAAVDLWQVGSWRLVGELDLNQLNVDQIGFSSDRRTLVVAADNDAPGAANNAVQLWDTVTRRPVGMLSHVQTNSVAFSPDGQTVAVASQSDVVQLWNVASRAQTGQLVNATAGSVARFWDVTFSPDGRAVAAVDTAGTVTIWDVASRRILTTLSCHCSAQQLGLVTVAFSPDGSLLAAGGEQSTVDVWATG